MLLVRFSILLSLFILLFSFTITAQVFNGEWSCKYATYDTTPMDNAVGQSVIDVSVIKENTFVALAHRVASTTIPSTHYLVGYTNADSAQGRMGLHTVHVEKDRCGLPVSIKLKCLTLWTALPQKIH
jgi:hypothetical protein